MEPFFRGFWLYLLIFSRILGLIFIMPVFSSENVPYRVRISLSVFLSFVFFPIVKGFLPQTSFESFYLYLMEFISQFFIGALIAFFIQVIFVAFILTGEFFSIQMGVSFSEILDPQTEASLPIIGTLKNIIALILFLTVDFEMDGYYVPAYLHVFRALYYSFEAVPTMYLNIQTIGGLLNYVDQSFGIMFLIALKIGLPLVGILFITSLALGLAGKTSPQLNLLNLGLQINILTGLIILIILMPVIIPLIRDAFFELFNFLGDLLNAWPK